MSRRCMVVIVVIIGLIGVIAIAQKTPIVPLTPLLLQRTSYYLTGNIESSEGTATTDRGRQGASLFGAIAFRVTPQEKGDLGIVLSGLNLVGKGVPTERGDSGVISISLARPESGLVYKPRTGEVSGEMEAILHYELIDRVKGYREQECKGECDKFDPYTERMTGKLSGRFMQPLQPTDKGSVQFEGELTFELTSEVLAAIRRVYIIFRVVIDWSLFTPAEVLKIQPVFIGSGASDPSATGTAFTTLMNYAHDMWNRCGTVRCIRFAVNAPIYVNNSAYRVLDNSAEATALRGEVNVADAVEVFVVERMSTSLACSWGGGATFSSGTASAKIVTCDQQMAVPCPCPSACTGYCPCGSCLCGAINPYHLAHELGHVLDLYHPSDSPYSTPTSIMEPSGFCCDNPNAQSAKNCRNADNPLLFWGTAICTRSPDIAD